MNGNKKAARSNPGGLLSYIDFNYHDMVYFEPARGEAVSYTTRKGVSQCRLSLRYISSDLLLP